MLSAELSCIRLAAFLCIAWYLHIMDLIFVFFKQGSVELISAIHIGTVEYRRFNAHLQQIFDGSDLQHIYNGTSYHAGSWRDLLLHSRKQHAGIFKITTVIDHHISHLIQLFPAGMAAGNLCAVLHIGNCRGRDSHL